MADVIKPQTNSTDEGEVPAVKVSVDVDPLETSEWIESLEYVIRSKGTDRAHFLLETLERLAAEKGVELPFQSNTPYINTIPTERQPAYPGNRELERRIKSIISIHLTIFF